MHGLERGCKKEGVAKSVSAPSSDFVSRHKELIRKLKYQCVSTSFTLINVLFNTCILVSGYLITTDIFLEQCFLEFL